MNLSLQIKKVLIKEYIKNIILKNKVKMRLFSGINNQNLQEF